MALVDVKQLLDAGVHYGHRASRWNPKMRPYIYGKRNLIHIIDLRETVRGLLRSYRYLSQIVSRGQLVLFVGTKRQGKEILEREAARCGMPYVSERWLGGTLTNFATLKKSLERLRHIEKMETDGTILNYVKRGDVAGTWLETHFRWQIRTFWFGLLWVALCLVFVVLTLGIGILIAWLPLAVVGLWFIYRIARGWLALTDRRPMY